MTQANPGELANFNPKVEHIIKEARALGRVVVQRVEMEDMTEPRVDENATEQ